MLFLLLIGICVVVVGGVAWRMRRGSAVDDAGLASRANADAERQKNPW